MLLRQGRIDPEGQRWFFRAVIVAGPAAIVAMEAYCRDQLSVSRIWLDVFEDNPRAIHVYEKLGYKRFKSELFEGRTLHFYEKNIV